MRWSYAIQTLACPLMNILIVRKVARAYPYKETNPIVCTTYRDLPKKRSTVVLHYVNMGTCRLDAVETKYGSEMCLCTSSRRTLGEAVDMHVLPGHWKQREVRCPHSPLPTYLNHSKRACQHDSFGFLGIWDGAQLISVSDNPAERKKQVHTKCILVANRSFLTGVEL